MVSFYTALLPIHIIIAGFLFSLTSQENTQDHRIVFTSNRNGLNEIFIMDADGSDPANLTNNDPEDDVPKIDFQPIASPDGRQLAFITAFCCYGNTDYITVMDVDGSNSVDLTEQLGLYSYTDLKWSPDGGKILFVRQEIPQESEGEIYVANVDGSQVTRLSLPDALDSTPDWSPDGEIIVFTSERDGNPEIYVMKNDGSNSVNLTNNLAGDYSPHWSPDGKHIAFMSRRDGNAEIYIMNTDGSNVRNLTQSEGDEFVPQWSPDGSKIAYIAHSTASDLRMLQVINADGSNILNLSGAVGNAGGFAWSPDSQQILFDVYDNNHSSGEIYVVSIDGSHLTNLTNNPESDDSPQWVS